MIQFFNQVFNLPKALNDGATKLQSLYRGYITREYTIPPGTLLNAFICDQVNTFIQLNRRKVTDVTSEINGEKKFFIKWDKTHEILTLFFPNKNEVGSGFWKKFFSSNTIKIPLTAKQKEIKQFESVWVKADNKTIDEIKIQEFLYAQFVKEMPFGVYFLEPLEKIHQDIYTQRRLNNKLDETEFNDHFKKSYCMRDIAKSLAWMHKQGMVHGDVSLKNFLVEKRTDDEGLLRLIAYLTDFGSTKRYGADQNRKLDDYVRWDPCKCFADITTPLVDWYGFMVTNIITWFPEMASYLKWEGFISTRRMIFENELSKNFISDALYWTGPKPFNDLTLIEQQAWSLFVTICKKSSQVYLHFVNNKGEVSKIEVEDAIKKYASEVERECLQFIDEMSKKAALPDL